MPYISLKEIEFGDIIECRVTSFVGKTRSAGASYFLRDASSPLQRIHFGDKGRDVIVTVSSKLFQDSFCTLELGPIACWVEYPNTVKLLARSKTF